MASKTTYLDGRMVAATGRERLKRDIEEAQERFGRPPGLAVVLVGHDPASEVYVKSKEKASARVGIPSRVLRLEETATTVDVVDAVERLNADDEVDGILVQLPLPQGVNRRWVLEALDPQKDVDGLTTQSQGLLAQGVPGLVPCTPAGILDLLKFYEIPISGRRVAVIGRSLLVGLPVSLLMLQENATVTVIHSYSAHPAEMTRQAEIVIAAAGQPGLVTRDWVNPQAVVVDVGIHRTPQGIVGDADFAALDGYVEAISPVPGGVGPMTIQELLMNTYRAYRERVGDS